MTTKSTPIELDLTTLKDEQLVALKAAGINVDAVGQELERRLSYGDPSEGLTELAQAGLDLEQYLDTHRGTPAVKEIRKLGVHMAIHRLIITMRQEGYESVPPVLKVLPPKPPKTVKAPPAPPVVAAEPAAVAA
jgi:hypothetical protein